GRPTAHDRAVSRSIHPQETTPSTLSRNGHLVTSPPPRPTFCRLPPISSLLEGRFVDRFTSKSRGATPRLARGTRTPGNRFAEGRVVGVSPLRQVVHFSGFLPRLTVFFALTTSEW